MAINPLSIMYVPSDMDAPGFYRLLSPARQLARQGHNVQLPPSRRFTDDNDQIRTEFTVELKEPQGDIWVLQQRRERMWADGAIHQLRAKGVAVVSDVDDNYLELPEWNPGFYGTHPHIRNDGVIINRAKRRQMPKQYQKAVNKNNRAWMIEVFKQSDAMTVSTPYLKDLYDRFCPNITVIRNYVDWDMWTDLTPMYDIERDRLRIGYLGAFNYRRGDLSVIKGFIGKFMLKHPEIDFVANSDAVHDYLDIPEEQRVTVGEWTFFPKDKENYPLAEMTGVLDIGLVPLMPGGMAEGKSHLKGLEYNAAGVPYIASDTESYRYFTQEGQNGYVVNTPSEWLERLESLVADDTTRRLMGAHGRWMAENHSIQANWHVYEHAYRKVLGDQLTKTAREAIKMGAVQKVSELRYLLECVEEAGRLRTVVEVGSARGGTFWALAQIAADDALLVSIDMPAGSPLDVRNGEDVYDGRDRERFRDMIRDSQRCVLLDGDSQSLDMLNRLIDTLGTTPIDVLFIDADHRYQGVKRDYGLYSTLVRPGGVIAFHDVIRQNDPRSGVHMLWAMLKKKHPDHTYEYVGRDNWGLGNWGGVGVLIKQGVPALV